uniref:Ig-like domain-containing protein n=1 Tax=Mesocestoides corti TaxID=53468 RepID=A0A5K3ET43_MESCO
MASLQLVLLILIIQVAVISAKYTTLPGDTRVVKGKKDDAFNYKTTLPGVYKNLTSGIHKVTFVNSNCSTPFFKCSYTQDSSDQMTVTMSGYMSYGLKWVTFKGDGDLVPISIVFFTDDVWNDMASGSIQPQYSVPLIVRAKNMHTVTLTCSIYATNPKASLYIGLQKQVYYQMRQLQGPIDNSAKFPQILNLEVRNIILHRVSTVTVKKNQDIDFYSCNTGDYWLTHTIDWTVSGATSIGFSFAVFIGILLCILH